MGAGPGGLISFILQVHPPQTAIIYIYGLPALQIESGALLGLDGSTGIMSERENNQTDLQQATKRESCCVEGRAAASLEWSRLTCDLCKRGLWRPILQKRLLHVGLLGSHGRPLGTSIPWWLWGFQTLGMPATIPPLPRKANRTKRSKIRSHNGKARIRDHSSLASCSAEPFPRIA